MRSLNIIFWIRITLINLLIVAALGLLMRYKIGFEFPHFDQRNLLHAHSHFAFSGWITQLLMLYITIVIVPFLSPRFISIYKSLLFFNLLCAYGMLFSFANSGYNTVSIIFSTCSIIVSYIYSGITLIHLIKHAEIRQRKWFIMAICLQLISTIGTAVLVVMMASGNFNQTTYLASVYWYLHFQYNGWFFFSSMGLLFTHINKLHPHINIPHTIFNYFAISSLPSVGLSVLWLNLPLLFYVLIILAAVCQVLGWAIMTMFLKRHRLLLLLSGNTRLISILLLFVFAATSIKLLLQLFSVIPSLSEMAFGFRPIVIAYLHLVLLGMITLFLLTYGLMSQLIQNNKIIRFGVLIIAISILLYESALAVQGIASLSYTPIPHIDQLLVLIAFGIFAGILVLVVGQLKSKYSLE